MKSHCVTCLGYHKPEVDCEHRIFHDESIPLSSPGDAEDHEDWQRGDRHEQR